MQAKALENGGSIGGSIGQVVVVVIRLKHVEQDFHVDLPFVAIGGLRLQSGEGVHKQVEGLVPVSAHQQVGVIPSPADDLAICMDLPTRSWG